MALTEIDSSAVAQLARLAHLALPESECAALAQRLSDFEANTAAMRAVPTEGVAPLVHALPADLSLRLCPDVVSEPDRRERYQQNAPAVQDGLFLVPQVIE